VWRSHTRAPVLPGFPLTIGFIWREWLKFSCPGKPNSAKNCDVNRTVIPPMADGCGAGRTSAIVAEAIRAIAGSRAIADASNPEGEPHAAGRAAASRRASAKWSALSQETRARRMGSEDRESDSAFRARPCWEGRATGGDTQRDKSCIGRRILLTRSGATLVRRSAVRSKHGLPGSLVSALAPIRERGRRTPSTGVRSPIWEQIQATKTRMVCQSYDDERG
jgi:hypothetical protein